MESPSKFVTRNALKGPCVLQPEGIRSPKWQVSRKLEGLHQCLFFCLPWVDSNESFSFYLVELTINRYNPALIPLLIDQHVSCALDSCDGFGFVHGLQMSSQT